MRTRVLATTARPVRRSELSLRHRTRWGGLGRPIDIPGPIASAVVAAAVLVAVFVPSAFGHGGVPTLQVTAERVHPGGTLDLLGDMTTEGPVDIQLVAPAEADVWSLGSVEADYEGHFRSFLIVPADVPVGEYRVRAQMATEQATTSIVVAGPPIAGEDGQLPGQDEAFAGAAASAAGPTAQPVSGPASGVVQRTTPPGADIPTTLLVVAAVVALAVLLGTVLRSRGRPAGVTRR
jgi:hypothetical protein